MQQMRTVDVPPRHDPGDYAVGVDLCQSKDYTAVCVVERVVTPTLTDAGDIEYPSEVRLLYLDRPPLGTKYPAIVTRVLALLDRAPLSREVPLVVDRTGVGAAVVDLFAAAGVQPQAVTITGGDAVIREDHHYKIPKRELAGQLVATHQSGRLKVAPGITLWPTLVQELINFKPKINITTGHDTYEAWRESVHDDLVLSVAMACWYVENRPAPMQLMDPEVAGLIENGWARGLFG